MVHWRIDGRAGHQRARSTRTHARTHTNTLSLSPTHTLSLSLIFSLSLSLSHTHTHSFSLSLSQRDTCTDARTRARARTLTHTDRVSAGPARGGVAPRLPPGPEEGPPRRVAPVRAAEACSHSLKPVVCVHARTRFIQAQTDTGKRAPRRVAPVRAAAGAYFHPPERQRLPL